MKRIILFLTLLCIEKNLHAQYVYTIKADSVKITNTCDTAELIIENHTQNVPGFLFNKGRGRTEFRRISQFNDTSVVIGGDTIHLGRGNKNFANADLTLTGDRVHDGALHSVGLYNFSYLDLFAGDYNRYYNPNTGGYNSNFAELLLDSSQGFQFWTYNVGNNTTYASSLFVGKSLEFGSPINNHAGASFHVGPGGFDIGDESPYGIGNIVYRGGSATDVGRMSTTVTNGWMEFATFDTSNNAGGKIIARLDKSDSFSIVSIRGSSQTEYKQTSDKFIFRNYAGVNDFRLIGLPASTTTADSMLVVDNNGQVKKRSQSPTRKSATVTASSYTVPADVDVVFVNYTGGTATITLPSGTLDREITIKNLNTTNSVALSGLDASESNTIATRGAITVKYTGSSWVGISKY
jgi:hypothetical protein